MIFYLQPLKIKASACPRKKLKTSTVECGLRACAGGFQFLSQRTFRYCFLVDSITDFLSFGNSFQDDKLLSNYANEFLFAHLNHLLQNAISYLLLDCLVNGIQFVYFARRFFGCSSFFVSIGRIIHDDHLLTLNQCLYCITPMISLVGNQAGLA